MRSFTIFFLIIISFQLIGQNVSNKQKTLITKRTATWCPLCGGWGWEMAKGLEVIGTDEAIIIRAHYSGDLESQVAADITNNWKGEYQPEFFINEEKQNVGSSTWSTKVQEFVSTVNDKSKNDANVGFEINSSISGDVITADVNIEFLADVTGSYYLGIYLVEDSIKNYQAAQGNNAIHNGVLRAEFSGVSFGSPIASNETEKGKVVKLSRTLVVEGDPIGDRFLKVLAIVLKKDGETYKVENLHEVEAGLSSSVSTQSINESSLSVVRVGSDIELSFSLSESFKSGRIEAYQMDGKKIINKYFHPSLNQNIISMPIAESNGKFIVVTVIGDEKLIVSKKVFIR